MIVRKGVPPAIEECDGPENRVMARRVSEAGGISQFGAHEHTLPPGGRASDRHWHAHEDEFLYVLEGEVTVVDNDGEHVLTAGDAACWPAGRPDAHQVLNRSDAPCRFLIVGSRVPHDVVHYPESGRTLTIEGSFWRLVGPDGKVIREGEEPS